MTQAGAATLQAVSTVALVVLTGGYLWLVRRQSSAAERSVERLVQRDLRRQYSQMAMVHPVMMSLQAEAQRWLDTTRLEVHSRKGTLPDDHLDVDNPEALRQAAAAGGSELNESVWRALESTRDAKRALSKMRRLEGRTGKQLKDAVRSFGQSVSDVKERSMTAAAIAKDEADRLELELGES